MSAAVKIVMLAHFHLCGSCGNVRVCEDNPCWLRYRIHAKQWAWTCSKCGGR
jgi:hypothetical protein